MEKRRADTSLEAQRHRLEREFRTVDCALGELADQERWLRDLSRVPECSPEGKPGTGRMPFAVGLARMERIARRQIQVIRGGQIAGLDALLDERRQIRRGIQRPGPAALLPMCETVRRILDFDAETSGELEGLRVTLLRRLGEMEKTRKTLSAYRDTREPPGDFPRFLDLRK